MVHRCGSYDWSKRLAALAEALQAIPCRSAVLDAVLCLPGPDSSPDFFGLLGAMGGSRSHELVVYAFAPRLGLRVAGQGTLRLRSTRTRIHSQGKERTLPSPPCLR